MSSLVPKVELCDMFNVYYSAANDGVAINSVL